MKREALSLDRFQALMAAYGTSTLRWPEAERKAAMDLLAACEPARLLAREQEVLDAWLSVPRTPRISKEVIFALNAIPVRHKKGLLTRRWRGRALWLPAIGWAAAAALGVWLGARSAAARDSFVKASDVERANERAENERLAVWGGAYVESEAP
jgi:hypothetical protein